MYCLKCGTQLPPDSLFCTNCGAKVNRESAPNVEPIAPPPMGQPYGNGQQPPKKNTKALLWILIGAAAALIAAAVLFFVVFAPGGGPFSGKTVQTRFANDALGVFTGAFSGFDNKNDMDQIADKPFEMDLQYSVEVTDVKTNMTIDAAYDEKALGMNVRTRMDYSNSELAGFFSDTEPMESTMKFLLLEDVLYIDQDGTTNGIRFDTEADLSKPMPFSERITALLNNKEDNSLAYLKLAEAFLNNIDEKCFGKSAKKTTLSLNTDELTEALYKLADQLENDDELNEAFRHMTKDLNIQTSDISELISDIEKTDFEMEWTVNYDGGTPAGIKVDYIESGSQVFELAFGYETQTKGKSINLELTDDSGQTLSVDLLLSKTDNGIEYEGTMDIPGVLDQISINGEQEINGNNLSGSMDITVLGMTVDAEYEGTVSVGKPKQAVADDDRFEMNTDDAVITDLEDGFGANLSQDLPPLDMVN